MKFITRTLIIATCCSLLPVRAEEKNTLVSQTSLARFESNCLLARELEIQVSAERSRVQYPDSIDKPFVRGVLATTLLKQFDAKPVSKDDLGASFFRYYRARLTALSGRYQEAKKEFSAVVGDPVMTPEALSELIGVDMVSEVSSQRSYERSLAKLLPASGFSERANSRETLRNADDGAPLVPVPSQSLFLVAEHLFEMRLYQRATGAYTEAICTSFPVRVVDPYGQKQSWLSHTSAPFWLKAAQSEWLGSGSIEKASDYAAKAIVFGSEATKNEALKTLSEWRQKGQTKPPTPLLDPFKIKRIANLYAEMNMHPRAIALVKEFAPVLGAEALQLQQRYEKEWLDLVERYCLGTTKCTLFGQDVLQKENRLKVIIPPPLRPEALAEAAKTVAALAKEK